MFRARFIFPDLQNTIKCDFILSVLQFLIESYIYQKLKHKYLFMYDYHSEYIKVKYMLATKKRQLTFLYPLHVSLRRLSTIYMHYPIVQTWNTNNTFNMSEHLMMIIANIRIEFIYIHPFICLHILSPWHTYRIHPISRYTSFTSSENVHATKSVYMMVNI